MRFVSAIKIKFDMTPQRTYFLTEFQFYTLLFIYESETAVELGVGEGEGGYPNSLVIFTRRVRAGT